MTAMAGFWHFGGDDTARRCRDMLAAQAVHAGGRPPVLASLGPVTLGRALFERAPPADHDRGPVRGGDGTLLLVADLRVDNRLEVAAAAGVGAPEAAVASDPFLVMRLVERRGIDAIAMVVGPFALAWWNGAQGHLVLARDVMGERPLHYHRGRDFVAFSSMPRALHTLDGVPDAPDPATVAEFLALIPETGSNSFFAGIERVRPGEIAEIRPDRITTRRYWSPPSAGLRLRRPEDHADALREQFDRAVARRLVRAEGGVGAQLSGGLDSAAVVAAAAPLLDPDRLLALTAVPAHDTPVPPGAVADEGPLAAATAARFPNVDHLRIPTPAGSVVAAADRHFHLYERPVLNPTNALWAEAINDAARARGASVLLTGQMGNMTISHGGLQHLPALVGRGRWLAALRLAWGLARAGRSAASIAALAVGPWLPPGWWRRLAAATGRSAAIEHYTALRADAVHEERIEQRAAARGLDLDYPPWRDGHAMRLWVLGRVDMGVYNKGTLGGWGLDLRDPTADRDLVAFCLSVPEEQFILGGVERSLARRAFADRLPAAVLGEHRRGFQAADWHVGLTAERQALGHELDSLDRCAPAARLIDVDRLRDTLEHWPEGGWNDSSVQQRYRHALTRGLAAGHFLRRATRSN